MNGLWHRLRTPSGPKNCQNSLAENYVSAALCLRDKIMYSTVYVPVLYTRKRGGKFVYNSCADRTFKEKEGSVHLPHHGNQFCTKKGDDLAIYRSY